jgi:acetyltransferase-like isoleucine patch superfamily enzyme
LFGPYGVSNCIEIMPFPYIKQMLRKYGAKVGKNCTIERGLILHRPNPKKPFKNLDIGDNVYIGHNILFDLTDEIHIGNDSALGARCQVWTHTGDWTYNRQDEKERINPVIIGKAVIVWSGAIISQNVKIHDYARIGANSIVLKDVKSRMIYAVIPSKEIIDRRF